MYCSVNAPFSYPELNVGSFKYGLAHEALKNEEYKNYLESSASEYFTILDNGADELGEGLSGSELLDLAEYIVPSELILPDVLGDSEATLKNSYDFLTKYRTSLVGLSLMAVPQGKTLNEWVTCFRRFNEDPSINTIGVPYDIDFDVTQELFSQEDYGSIVSYLDRVPSLRLCTVDESSTKTKKRARRRLNLVRLLFKFGLVSKPIHLLGMNDLWELDQYSKIQTKLIRSNDTTAPFACSKRRWEYLDSGEKDWPALDFNV